MQRNQLFSSTPCKYSSKLPCCNPYCFSNVFTLSTFKHKLHRQFSLVSVATASVSNIDAKLSSNEHEHSTKTMISESNREKRTGFSSSSSGDERVDRKYLNRRTNRVVEGKVEKKVGKDGYTRKYLDSIRKREISPEKDGYTRRNLDSRGTREVDSGFSSLRSKNGRVEMKSKKANSSPVKKPKAENGSSHMGGEEMDAKPKKNKVDSQGVQLRFALDMCSKKGDVMGAISLHDFAQREGIKLGQYHYTVLLYLCSSAAVGVVHPAKSGSGSRSFKKLNLNCGVHKENSVDSGEMREKNFDIMRTNMILSNKNLLLKCDSNSDKMESDSSQFPVSAMDDGDGSLMERVQLIHPVNGLGKVHPKSSDRCTTLGKGEDDSDCGEDINFNHEDHEIQVRDDVRKYALTRGFEIYGKMCLEKVPLNEAALTSVARMAMSMGNGDMAFDMVKQMKPLGINPRLRSYGPSLNAFCNSGNVEKAFLVEEHMFQNGVYPEEPELAALLRLSVGAGRADKVYYLLHKLRTSVRQVSPPTADWIEKWFRSKAASRVGKRKWDQNLIKEEMKNGGGGWHGQGWLGKGAWTVVRTSVGADGICEGCGEKLATIDLDPTETQNFAESVASIAAKREKNSSFQKFQKWLDYYGPFEAVIDAANVGLFSQKRFLLPKVNAVVNGIRQKLPSKKWPLIVVHNRRITGGRMNEPPNRTLIEKWRNADALYATPTGSNDDWYWLYAAIKFKCLIVTNDEMRDHIFQLLGNDFFPRWKERHHVHFSFHDTGPEFHMPPPCSIVIQESEKGLWHIPILLEQVSERTRTWLCVTRAKSLMTKQDSSARFKDVQSGQRMKLTLLNHHRSERLAPNAKLPHQEIYRSLRTILLTSKFSEYGSILPEIEAAEKLGSCIIDFQI